MAGLKALGERAAPGGGGLLGLVGASKVKDAKVQKVRFPRSFARSELRGAWKGLILGPTYADCCTSVRRQIAERYTAMFNALTALSSEEDGPMIRMSFVALPSSPCFFPPSNAPVSPSRPARLARLRSPLDTLITAQASKITNPQAREAFMSGIYDRLVAGLRLAFAGLESHEKGEGTAAEIAFWKGRAEGVQTGAVGKR